MSNSLIISLLLLCALVIVLVLGVELLRAWRLRKDRVSVPIEVPRRRGRAAESVHAAASRQEPELDGSTVSAPQRAEPDLGPGDPKSAPAQRIDPFLDPPRSEPVQAAAPDLSPPWESAAHERAPVPPAVSAASRSAADHDRSRSPAEPASDPAQRSEANAGPQAAAADAAPIGSGGALQAAPPHAAATAYGASPGPVAKLAPATGAPAGPGRVVISSSAASVGAPTAGSAPVGAPIAGSAPVGAPIAGAVDAAPAETVGAPARAQPAPVGVAALPVLSNLTDCIVDLACIAPVSGERLIALSQAFRRCGTKPVTLEVAVPSPDGSGGRNWRGPHPLDSCRALRIGILLDNRSGALNAMEFSEFLARTQELADRVGAQYKAPLMSEVLQAARRLDADCAQLDCTASVNVEADEALGPAQLASLAGPLAIIERGNHRYARMTADGEALFSVLLGDRPNRLSFLLDLPRVSSPISAWQQMIECALVASRRLPGRLVDSSGRPLTDRIIDSSAANVRQRAFALEAAGLKPGSPLALRVFNG